MKHCIILFTLILSPWIHASESTVTVPWEEFNVLYKERIEQKLKIVDDKADPIIVLEHIEYNLEIKGTQAIGIVSITGNVLIGDPVPIPVFGQKIAVTAVLETENATLLAKDDHYRLHPFETGVFSIKFSVSIPISNFQSKPKLEFQVPTAVRNEINIETSESLKLLSNESLHKIDGKYYFSPTNLLNIEFEHINLEIEGSGSQESLLTEVETPDAVLESVNFFVSFAEDGSVLSAIHLLLPQSDKTRMELTPIDDAEVWSLNVNDQPRSLYRSPMGKWVIPLDSEADSKVILAYLTHNTKLGLDGRLDFSMPETGLTARQVNLTVGLPERMHMLAMESSLQPASGVGWPKFASFNGRPHFFSKPFYKGHALASSIIYQEPANQ